MTFWYGFSMAFSVLNNPVFGFIVGILVMIVLAIIVLALFQVLD